MTTDNSQASGDGRNYSNLGSIVQLGLLELSSKNKSKRAEKARLQQVAWDPDNSVKLPVEWTPPGDGTLAENFQAILKQLPSAPGIPKLIRAWLSYNEAIKIAERSVDSITKPFVFGQSTGKPNMGSILSTVCKWRDLYEKSQNRSTRRARSASSIHDSTVEEHEHSDHQSVKCARNGSLGSPANIASPISSVPSKRVRKRTHAVLSRYSRAAKRPELFNMIQQHRAKDREAAQEFMDITRNALEKQAKRRERARKYREPTLGVHQQTSRGNRVSKTPSRKPPQQIKVNEKYVNIGKQKKGLDRLFAEAGY